MSENENDVINDGSSKKSSVKKIVIGVVVLAVIIAIIIGIVNIVKPTPEKAVKNFLKYMGDGKVSKAFDMVDMVGIAAFQECDGDYEDFKDNYEDYKDEYEDAKDEAEDYLDKMVESMEEEIEDYEKFDIEIKKVKSAKKVKGAKNLYKVSAKFKTTVKEDDDSDTEKETNEGDFYVYKVKGKYLIVGVESEDGSSSLLGF